MAEIELTAEELAAQQAAVMARGNQDKQAQNVVAAMESAGENTVPAMQAAGHRRAQSNMHDGVMGALGFGAIFNDPHKGEFAQRKQSAHRRASVCEKKADPKFDAEAADEHSWGHVSLCASPEDMLMRHGLGQGVMWYLKFGQFIILYNLGLVVIAMLSFIPSLAVGPQYEGARFRFPGVFYLSTYPADVYPAYAVSVTFMLICTFALGPVYRYYVHRWTENQRELRQAAAEGDAKAMWVEGEFEGRYGRENFDFVDDEAVDIKDDYGFDLTTRYYPLGVFFSGVIMAAVLAVSGVVTFYMQKVSRRAGGNSLGSFFIALFVSFMAFVWEIIVDKLTYFERWAYWSDYWKSSCIKVLLFKILNIFTVFLVKRIEFQDDESACQLQDLGDQFLLLIAMNSSTTLAHLLYVRCSDKNAERDEYGAREFILSQEYVELVYRQFLIHLGFLVMPMISVFGLIANIIEYSSDKYRMLRLAHKPKAISATFSGVLAFYFFFSAMFVLLSYPNGAVFMLAGSFGLKDSKDCYVYQ